MTAASSKVDELRRFLAANVDIHTLDGDPKRAAAFQQHLNTLTALIDAARDGVHPLETDESAVDETSTITDRLQQIEARAEAANLLEERWETLAMWAVPVGADGITLNDAVGELHESDVRPDVLQLVAALRAVLNLADWHETKAEKARRFPGGPSSIGEAEAKARVPDDAARRIRTAITDNLMEDHDE